MKDDQNNMNPSNIETNRDLEHQSSYSSRTIFIGILIPIIIILIMSIFMGKTKAMAMYLQIRTTFWLIIFGLIFFVVSMYTFHLIFMESDKEKRKKNMRTSIIATIIFFILFLISFLFWKHISKSSNKNKARYQGVSMLTNMFNGIWNLVLGSHKS